MTCTTLRSEGFRAGIAWVLPSALTFTANSIGIAGNTISLVFNGSDTIAQVVDNWNTNNPAIPVGSDAPDDSVILTATTLNLTGGLDNVAAVTLMTPEVLGKVQVELSDTDTNSLKIGKNQTMKLKIEKGDEARIVLFRNAITVIKGDF